MDLFWQENIGLKMTKETSEDLMVLCYKCHKKVHQK
jgi:predicted HNH restriction endonuclease